MSSCSGIRPLLPHVAASELSPHEAISVARHQADCTACKILLAREDRLAEILEQDLEDFPVGEDFVQSVMDNLPQGPPPQRRRRERRRGLRLAGLAGALGAGSMWVANLTTLGSTGGGRIGSPALDLESAPGTLESIAGLVKAALVALDAVARFPTEFGPALTGGLVMAPLAAAMVMVGLGACSGFLALAARSLARSPR